MGDFQHLVVTRFNLKVDRTNWPKHKQATLQGNSSEWMAHRWQLFMNYCLPSMVQQSQQNFRWLIYLDPATPTFYINQLKQISQQHSFIYIKYASSYQSLFNQLTLDIQLLIGNEAKYLITSRIDNDDCFHKEAIQAIQGQFNKQDYQVVNLAKGICFQIEPCYQLSESVYYSGPFCSLIEAYSAEKKPLTVMYKDHHDYILESSSPVQILGQALWMQIIHQQNASNELSGKPIRAINSFADFGIGKTSIPIDRRQYFFNRCKYYLKELPILRLKNAVKKCLSHPISHS